MEKLPFRNLTAYEIEEEYDINGDKCKLNNRLSDVGFQSYLINARKLEAYKAMDTSYYTVEHFNHRFRKVKKNIELSIFHLNIRSLNSKQRSFCQLIELIY